ncbi:MAG: MGMT family protein [Elusimicrobia bacterium]|nr:MGMT family protein [Elusimicrobiota bacterium]
MSEYPPFYQRVWRECAKIPKGKTLTYGELARRLGKPGAARAVGRALGANPFAPVVPCHRVVAAAGLGGFTARGGVRAKERLLRKEGALPKRR